MHRQTLHFSFDVPQRQIERADGMGLFAARGIEKRPVHVLPEQFDVLRVAADQSTRGLGQHVLRSALPDAGDSGVGFDGDHHVALIEQRVRIGWQIGSHPRDLHLRKRGKGGQSANRSRDGGGCQRPDKVASFHGLQPRLVGANKMMRVPC